MVPLPALIRSRSARTCRKWGVISPVPTIKPTTVDIAKVEGKPLELEIKLESTGQTSMMGKRHARQFHDEAFSVMQVIDLGIAIQTC